MLICAKIVELNFSTVLLCCSFFCIKGARTAITSVVKSSAISALECFHKLCLKGGIYTILKSLFGKPNRLHSYTLFNRAELDIKGSVPNLSVLGLPLEDDRAL